MPDGNPNFLRKILNESGDLPEENTAFTSERQLTAHAFNLHIEKKDGLETEGFAWSHYKRCWWSGKGGHETLVIFYDDGAIEIEGHNLGVLVGEIREGQLNSIREMVTGEAMLGEKEGTDKPIISTVKTYPDPEELLKEIKGEQGHDTGFARKVRGR